MGHGRVAGFSGSGYFYQLGTASAVLHVPSDMQHEECEMSLSWKCHSSSSALPFNGAVKTIGYRRRGGGGYLSN